MKRPITLFLLLFISFSVSANEMTFFSGTWAETLQKAKTENKYVMLDCYTDWCGWCKVMDKETFTDASVINEFNSSFIGAKREMEKTDEGQLLGLKYHIRSYPAYLFFSPEGVLVYVHHGYVPAKDFVAVLQKLRKKENQQSFPGLSKELNPGFPAFCIEVLKPENKKNSKGKNEELNRKAIAYLDSSRNLYSEASWAVMWRFPVLNEKYDNWIFQNVDTLRYLYGERPVEIKLANTVGMQVSKACAEKNEVLFADALSKCKYFGKEASTRRFEYSVRYYSDTNDWTKLVSTLQGFADTAGYQSAYAAMMLNENSWAMYENCEDMAALQKVTGLMKNLCAAHPEYAYLDTYAALLYKTGNYAEAEIQANKAIDAGRAEKTDTSSTEGLLQNIRMKKK